MLNQAIQCLLVERRSCGLQDNWRVRCQPAVAELLQDTLGRAWHGAWRVHIFYAYQPLPPMGARIEPTGQRCDQ